MNFTQARLSLFPGLPDIAIKSFTNSLSNSAITVVGPELVFGKVFDCIVFSEIEAPIFCHLVAGRIIFPGSKLKTVAYQKLFHRVEVAQDWFYLFLDKLEASLEH
jgi:hypothetical protein